jgi:hypothetical protein
LPLIPSTIIIHAGDFKQYIFDDTVVDAKQFACPDGPWAAYGLQPEEG